MKISRIYAENYKTYKLLDLDLEMKPERPIILIGGGNGCGKTTLFDAIYHALYGLKIKSVHDFEELFNAGVKLTTGMKNQKIILRLDFSGKVMNSEQQYRLQRTYMLTDRGVHESVALNMGGNNYVYGTGSTQSQRNLYEDVISKVIAANLPKELSSYFLFDAMKTSDLVREEQINKLIEKNINSVMGLRKYIIMKQGSETLLDEKKKERIENENQRLEFEGLIQQKQNEEAELKQLKDKYTAALDFANEHQKQYEELKAGRNADDVTRDKMSAVRHSIEETNRKVADFRKSMELLTKDIETDVIYPKLASVLSAEIKVILNAKDETANARAHMLSDLQIETLTTDLVSIIEERYLAGGKIDVSSLIEEMKLKQERDHSVDDRYDFLTTNDINRLKELVSAQHVNHFVMLDDQREDLTSKINELSSQQNLLKEYQRTLNSRDYSLIELYERNAQEIKSLKEDIDAKKDEIRKLQNKISTYDFVMPQVPDPQYDLLCKLPDFLKDLYDGLLKIKKSSIERMMRDQLNLNLVVYAGMIGEVKLSSTSEDGITFKIYHKDGNEIYLSQLNAGAKQTVMQVLLKVLYDLGDYEPPVMIDTVMGVLDKASREVILEHYFPDLANQTILLSTDTEITNLDFAKIQAHVAKTYTLHRDKENQCTTITDDYFGLKTKDI